MFNVQWVSRDQLYFVVIKIWSKLHTGEGGQISPSSLLHSRWCQLILSWYFVLGKTLIWFARQHNNVFGLANKLKDKLILLPQIDWENC